MFFEVTDAEYVDNYRINLTFEDGSSGLADLSDYPNRNNVFRLFLDMNYFRNFRIEYGTVIWGDGELDIAPEKLYTIATGKVIEYNSRKSQLV